MRMLPEDRRNGMYAVYAFCREVDDIADDAPAAEKAAGLAAWRDEIEAVYAGRPRLLVARALVRPVERYRLRKSDFHDVIDGMGDGRRRGYSRPDLATLDLYCARVAGAVGHLSVHVFGDPSAAAHRVADSLGRALQPDPTSCATSTKTRNAAACTCRARSSTATASRATPPAGGIAPSGPRRWPATISAALAVARFDEARRGDAALLAPGLACGRRR